MALTAQPVPGNTILAAWGTEIRNRAIQVFGSAAEANTWAAPNGSVAFTTDTYRFRVRIAGAWVPFSPCLASNFQGTTNVQSDVSFTHNLGVVPRSVIVTPDYSVNGNTAMLQVTARNASAATVRVRNYNGVGQADTLIGFYWMVAA